MIIIWIVSLKSMQILRMFKKCLRWLSHVKNAFIFSTNFALSFIAQSIQKPLGKYFQEQTLLSVVGMEVVNYKVLHCELYCQVSPHILGLVYPSQIYVRLATSTQKP